MIPVFELANTFHALDDVATVIGGSGRGLTLMCHPEMCLEGRREAMRKEPGMSVSRRDSNHAAPEEK